MNFVELESIKVDTLQNLTSLEILLKLFLIYYLKVIAKIE